MNNRVFPADVFWFGLEKYSEIGDAAINPRIRGEIKKFVSAEKTHVEIYDFCLELSELYCLELSDNLCYGDIDSFGKTFFNIVKEYERPHQ